MHSGSDILINLQAEASIAEGQREAKPTAASSSLPGQVQLSVLHDPDAASLLHKQNSASLQLDLEAGTLPHASQEARTVVSNMGAAPLLQDHEEAALLTPT